MKRTLFIPAAGLLLLAACTENSSKMTENNELRSGQGGTTANPEYTSSTYSIVSGFGLNHSWRQKGLGSFTQVDYLLSANANITAHCENRGNNTVQGAPFQVSQALSSGPGPQTPRNGAINGSITLSPASVVCQPPGGNPHEAVIDAVVYSEIEFCWGKTTPGVTDLQGPVPGGPGSGETVPPNQSGSPLAGTESQASGIFATCAST
jgi:hypothetical protein